MRNNRKLYLMTHKEIGVSLAFDEAGAVDDPVDLIVRWANENLENDEIERLRSELGQISEFGEDAPADVNEQAARNERQRRAMAGDSAHEPFSLEAIFGRIPREQPTYGGKGYSETVTRGAADSAWRGDASSLEAFFPDAARIRGSER
jgi:hypothetical protein